jgi:hypothetical protein
MGTGKNGGGVRGKERQRKRERETGRLSEREMKHGRELEME